MNRYLIKAIIWIAIGILIIFCSYKLMNAENDWYKLLMSIGVIIFGIGFIMLIYSFFRKIDRRTLQEHRRQKKNENTE